MPRRTDIKSILIIGAGPIVIGQACEFDYSGTQACKALKAEGYRIILVNSNPATIMTDPELADATYIEPITPEVVAKIIAKERPDALLPTMGGQTALNTALSLRRMGVLERYNVEMIGADADAIDMAEDRSLFREAMARIGLETPKSMLANASAAKDADRKTHEAERAALKASGIADMDAALDALETHWNLGEGDRKQRYVGHALGIAAQALDHVGLPAIIRPSFTMGGTGGGIAYNRAEFFDIIASGLDASPTTEVLIEEIGARLEGIRDGGGPRPRGQLHHRLLHREHRPDGRPHRRFHHGRPRADADGQRVPDHAQRLDRGAARDRRRNRRLQRPVRRQPGRRAPRRHRDEPARVALLRACLQGDRLPDCKNRGKARRRLHAGRARQRHHRRRDAGLLRTVDRLRRDQDPALCLRKVPRRRADADHRHEVGRRGHGDRPHVSGNRCRRHCAALRPALTGLDEIEIPGIVPGDAGAGENRNAIRAALGTPTPDRLRMVAQAIRMGTSLEEVHQMCRIDPWFLEQIAGIIAMEARIREHGLPVDAQNLRMLKSMGFSDARLASLTRAEAPAVAALREKLGVHPVYKRIDTCAAEFASPTPYMYSTYEVPFDGAPRSEAQVTSAKKVVILGGGPNRIGQGIEFDYCCCHAAFALREAGFEAIMVNCNPETVSTDYDTFENPARPPGARRLLVSVDPRAVLAAQPDVVHAGRDLLPGDLHDERAVAPAAPPQRRSAAAAAPHHHDHARRRCRWPSARSCSARPRRRATSSICAWGRPRACRRRTASRPRC